MNSLITIVLAVIGLVADILTIGSFIPSNNVGKIGNSVHITIMFIITILAYFSLLNFYWIKSKKINSSNYFWDYLIQEVIRKPQSKEFVVLTLINGIFIAALPLEDVGYLIVGIIYLILIFFISKIETKKEREEREKLFIKEVNIWLKNNVNTYENYIDSFVLNEIFDNEIRENIKKSFFNDDSYIYWNKIILNKILKDFAKKNNSFVAYGKLYNYEENDYVSNYEPVLISKRLLLNNKHYELEPYL